ncbi:MAG: hypothetical protein EA394_11120 [Bacteroidia bacterium]|nr:MAG: hypothetical protein EA394_11120 [Bacteroidia bacterium]
MKTKTMLSVILLTVFLSFPFCLNAQSSVELRQTDPFTGVQAGSVLRVHLTQGDIFHVEVEAPEEHLAYIETKVEDDILSIDYKGRERNLKGLHVHITAPVFEYIHASGASVIKGVGTLSASVMQLRVSGASEMDLTVFVDELTTNISGASNIRLSGAAAFHDLNAGGVAGVRAYDLDTEVSIVKSSGTSSIRVTVLESIEVEASGASSIIVRGNPVVTRYQKSAGATIRGLDPSPVVQPPAEEAAVIHRHEEDTLIVSVGRREVVIVEGRRPEVRTRPLRRHVWRNEWTGFYLGINGYTSPDRSLNLEPGSEFMDLEYNNSIQVNLNLWQQNLVLARGAHSAFGIYTGVGFSWNNYRFANNIRLVTGDDQLEHFTDTIHNFRRNKLTVSHLNVPFMFEFQTRNRQNGSMPFHISAGVNAGVRLRSHTKQVYRAEGSRQTDKDRDDFYLAPFRYDAMVTIGWGQINLFATYALNDMFREDKGPELVPFSVGIRLLNF